MESTRIYGDPHILPLGQVTNGRADQAHIPMECTPIYCDRFMLPLGYGARHTDGVYAMPRARICFLSGMARAYRSSVRDASRSHMLPLGYDPKHTEVVYAMPRARICYLSGMTHYIPK